MARFRQARSRRPSECGAAGSVAAPPRLHGVAIDTAVRRARQGLGELDPARTLEASDSGADEIADLLGNNAQALRKKLDRAVDRVSRELGLEEQP